MADFQPPAPARKPLFKRTVKRKSSSEKPDTNDDGLSLFSRAKDFFPTVIEDQQKRAQEKAAKAEQERKDKLARAHREEQDALQEQILREEDSAKKRRRAASPAFPKSEYGGEDDLDDDDDDDVFVDRPRKSRKSSAATPTPQTPSGRHQRPTLGGSRSRGSGSTRALRSRKATTPIVTLGDSSDDDVKEVKPTIPDSKAGLSAKSKQTATVLSDSEDSGLEVWDKSQDKKADGEEEDDEEEDPSAFYVRAAMERMEKAKAERLAREQAGLDGSSAPAPEEDPPVQILIISQVAEMKAIVIKYRTRQGLQVAFDSWKQMQRRTTAHLDTVIDSMIFTWKRNQVYGTTTMETLGVRPDAEGKLWSSWQTQAPEGYFRNGADQVCFEAWTREQYDEYLELAERDRRRELGELDDENDEAATPDQEQEQEAAADKKIKVIFKARDMPPKNATVRLSTTVALMIRVFRKLANVPADKSIELHWDGEVLGPEMTVEEADIGDMDSVEVHIR
ncbi:Uu.00g040120.m01.CDS01 [Anthostomella pinea]|uniref:Uu.00g040120.m01.CDS01 n=1 Tax=Anthostomella pinea TaxID=933095 RepID=A0AAI8VA06_9PEZI|nr:Uu.00g040120.m01.CDS01 [Anthostomella pinea]